MHLLGIHLKLVLQDLFRSTAFEKKYWSHKIYISHIPDFVYSICIQDPKIPAVLSFSSIYFLSKSLLVNISFTMSSSFRHVHLIFQYFTNIFANFHPQILESDLIIAFFQHLLSFQNKVQPV